MTAAMPVLEPIFEAQVLHFLEFEEAELVVEARRRQRSGG
jgi:hypothetical protein